MEFLLQTEPESISAAFREYSQFPTPGSVTVCPEVSASGGAKYISLLTEWSQNETDRGNRLRFGKQYTLLCDSRTVQHVLPLGHCSHVQGELVSSHSPSGTLKAVVRETSCQGKGHQFLEIWNKHGMTKSLDLTSLNKHGRVYEDAQFGCLAWSACEGRVLYVAERKRPKAESSGVSEPRPSSHDAGAGHSGEELTARKEDRNVYWEDWGEGLSNKSVPVLCVVDIDKCTVSVLQGVPAQVSPGQALWSPQDEGVLFVGWWHEPFRLGLKFCSNRRSALFHVDLEGNCECLSSDSNAVSSPRLSPDKRYIIYLQGQVFGPHNQCLSLQLYDWETKRTSLLVDVVKRPEDEFAGVYEALPTRCWSADSQRVVFSSARRNWKGLFVLDRCTRKVTPLVDHEEFGSWKLLAIERDLMVVNCTAPNSPPCLKVGFLPPAGGEAGVSWTPLDEPRQIPLLEWRALDITPTPQEENMEYSGLDFGALLVKPRAIRSGVKVPLVVFAHGGPHSQFSAEWNVSSAALARVGFAVLMVNYRGSTGFGQDSILSLIGNIGNQDVKDVQRAVLSTLQNDATLDPTKVAVMGGSHGGFLACHLIGQYPDFYRACAARNPVINAATLLGTSDIIDWRYSSVGLQYSLDRLPSPDALTTMFHLSPIAHASQIRTPVLLMLGGKDKRVSPHQGLELYRALKSRSSPVRLLWFAEDGHSLSRVDTQADCFLNVVLWFLQHLDLL
ncbi:S9 family peptidase [Megalops cyprinoides]|uniref:S9 family peptidase n=1 Tax=Megalops cyprinoides TaxID=118141 RepID=UPI001865628E|nr:S9 family peptidase [Megalops cyprinoides]